MSNVKIWPYWLASAMQAKNPGSFLPGFFVSVFA